MNYETLLKALEEFDKKDIDSQFILENLDTLEKVNSNLHGLIINARVSKFMQDFGQKETDIYVVGYPRSGSTLMQMILYQMTTDGSLEFDHIYDVSPWCRYSAFINQPMKSVGTHRIIKTHDSYEMFGTIKKGKFIFIVRDCLDVVSSVYQQARDYIDPQVAFESLSHRNMKKWCDYNLEWSENKDERKILFIHYEDLLKRKEEIVRVISKFIEVEVNDEIIQRVLHTTSFDFMKKHESKFGEQPNNKKVYNNFIRRGKSGKGKDMFNESQLQVYIELSKGNKIADTVIERYFKDVNQV